MSNPTTPFNWQMPTSTDLVTDLPADFEVFGQAVASSMADLLGGTTGQILSKATNTDMDFTWVSANPGDITGVTATSPLTGGGTSGDVTIGIQAGSTTQSGAVQLTDSTSSTSTTTAATPNSVKTSYDLANAAIAKSTVTTAGDIIYRNATVPTRLGIGTAGQILTVNSGATAPEWKTPSGGGKVLQVVYGSTSTQVTNSTNSTVDTGLTATITPTSATSTILVLIGQQGIYKQNGNNSSGLKLILLRGATTIYNISDIFTYNATSSEVVSSISAVYKDSPATTSATTYKTVFSNYANAAAVGVQFVAGTLAMTSTITLLEIGA